MKSKQEILQNVRKIFSSRWTTKDGRVIPSVDDVGLGTNSGVELEAAVLYADLTDSTGLVDRFKATFAAEIYKAYLHGACEVVKNNSGAITAFDGDRVMAVFLGDTKNTQATKAALQISAIVKAMNIELGEAYPSTSYTIRHTIGIDSGNLLVAKTGVWKFNDLVWVGSPANYAAKLCVGGDEDYPIRITKRVYSKLSDSSKYGGDPRLNMWKRIEFPLEDLEIYGSNWFWDF
ncbi:class 3 adenylate cyclase [Oxalobacteraceae bacterium GrIS 2.11]